MTKIDAKTVKQLRDMTGAPMMDCKSALAETGGDIDKAKDVLRKRGTQVAAKASGREVSEGLIYGYTHHNGKLGVMVEVVCETDFVAMNEDFKAFCHGVALSVAAFNPSFLDKKSVPADAVEKEQAIVTEMTKESMAGKPENVIEKAVAGRMEKWFGEQSSSTSFKARNPVADGSEFIRLYSENCFSSISRITEDSWQGGFLTGETVSDMAKELLLIRARLMSNERHHVTSQVKALLSKIDALEDSIQRSDRYNEFLFVRALIKLNLLFCTEDPRGTFDHAMAVSAALENDLLKAYTLRYANFIEGNSLLKTHLLQRAEDIFVSAHIHDHALYCRNNRLTTHFRLDKEVAEDFDLLVEDVESLGPHLSRKEDIIYNAGLMRLISGDYESAFDHFFSAEYSGGRALISAASRTGMLVSKYLDGQTVDLNQILEVYEYLVQNVDPSNKYHITSIKLNLLLLAKKSGCDYLPMIEAFGDLFLDGTYDVRDSRRSNDYMASKLGIGKAFSSSQDGVKGQFVKKHDFAMPYFYIWS